MYSFVDSQPTGIIAIVVGMLVLLRLLAGGC